MYWFATINKLPFAFSATALPTDPELVWKDEIVEGQPMTIHPAKHHGWVKKSAEDLPVDTHILRV